MCNKTTSNVKCCSQTCAAAHGRSKKQKQIKSFNLCLVCDFETNNLKFCSTSCAAVFNNKNRKKQSYYCSHCNSLIGKGYMSARKTLCSICRLKIHYPNYNKTLSEIKSQNLQLTNFHSTIRSNARRVYKNNNPKMLCFICGYSLHIDVCHIKPVADFKLTAKLCEVNHPDNLVGLCKNHHWEFDNGLLKLS